MTGMVRQDGRIVSSLLSPLPANILRGIVPTATLWDGNIGHAFQDDGGVFTDLTTAANNATANDVALLPAVEAVNDAFYFGDANNAFNHIKINIGQAGVGDTIAWEYYNGAAWAALTVVDGTSGFTVAGSNNVTFTAPGDWAKTVINGQNDYWVRARCTAANFTTQPLATQIWIGIAPTSLANATDGDFSAVTGTGVVVKGAAGDFGYITFDLGSVKTVMATARIGKWSSAGSVSVYWGSSDDDSTYRDMQNSTSGSVASTGTTSTSEVILDSYNIVLTGRYIRLRCYVSAAATCNLRLYEAMAFEVMK